VFVATIVQELSTFQSIDVDPVTIDIIEGSLRNARDEMDAIVYRTAMSPAIRDQHDCFPMICDAQMRMVVGQFGAFIEKLVADWDGEIEQGDVIFTSDPYKCSAAISHANDWLVFTPIFADGRVVGWASMIGHMTDVGGRVPGSLPTDARTIFEEGALIPPVKLYSRGVLREEVLELILNQVRLPEWNRADLNALVAACRAAERRVRETCERFGVDVYNSALEALLQRNYAAIEQLIQLAIPEDKVTFEDYVDDDGRGFGPYRLQVSMWREGGRLIVDWDGTDPQAEGPINFLLNDSYVKLMVASLLIMVFDPQILFNEGCYPLIEVRVPEGTLLSPRYPAALSCRTHVATRFMDVIAGLLGKGQPALLCAAGMGSSPHLMYSGRRGDGTWFQLYQIGHGGVPGRPTGDGPDGHSMWPYFKNIPSEYLESHYPLRIERYESVPDSGGPGLHRGGNGLSVVYRFLEAGEISIHDDRWFTPNWGVNGGLPGARSRKILTRIDGSVETLPAKCDYVHVAAGDQLEFITWGCGGWGDPYQREPDLVAADVRAGLVSRAGAGRYGVVIDDAGRVDGAATEALRNAPREVVAGEVFDFGGSVEERRERCLVETGLEPPRAPMTTAAARG
jgi:N-methylhydantoinase B